MPRQEEELAELLERHAELKRRMRSPGGASILEARELGSLEAHLEHYRGLLRGLEGAPAPPLED